MSQHHPPAWDTDGQPVNLAAAAQDALEWLRLFRRRTVRSPGEPRERLERCIAALETFLPRSEFEHAAPELDLAPAAPLFDTFPGEVGHE